MNFQPLRSKTVWAGLIFSVIQSLETLQVVPTGGSAALLDVIQNLSVALGVWGVRDAMSKGPSGG